MKSKQRWSPVGQIAEKALKFAVHRAVFKQAKMERLTGKMQMKKLKNIHDHVTTLSSQRHERI